MSRYLRYTLLTLLWVAVAAYIVFAASAVRRVRRTGTVGAGDRGGGTALRRTSGLGSDGPPVVRMPEIITSVTAVDVEGTSTVIERSPATDSWIKNGCLCLLRGTLHIEISQRKPLVRRLPDGMNACT